ncbi:hypothetical protein SAMN05444344_2151 [Tenacibaculum mesophilum]|nr:hypothetical protein SAMN05444344_2151 [Tenacibaculum mesophilum]
MKKENETKYYVITCVGVMLLLVMVFAFEKGALLGEIIAK